MVKLEQTGAQMMCVSSPYIAHDRWTSLEELQHLMPLIAAGKANLLIGCQSNPRLPFWCGGKSEKKVGLSLTLFLIQTYQYVTRDWSTEVRLTRGSSQITVWILFSINLAVKVAYSFRDPKRINWKKFDKVIRNKRSVIHNGNIGTADELMSKVGTPEKSFKHSKDVEWRGTSQSWRLPPDSPALKIESTRESVRLSTILVKEYSSLLFLKSLKVAGQNFLVTPWRYQFICFSRPSWRTVNQQSCFEGCEGVIKSIIIV